MEFDHDSGAALKLVAINPGASALTIAGSTGVVLPSGTTAQRIASPGVIRFNTDTALVESYTGSSWTNLTSSNSIVSFDISSWITLAGNLYYADVVHNMSTFNISVVLWDATTHTLVHADRIVALNNSTVRITVADNTAKLTCVVVAPGAYAATNGTSPILRTLTYYASSLDSPNNSDWAVNSLAAAIADPLNPALTVRQFSNTTEQGVGFNLTVPANASYVTFRFKGRAQTAPTSASVVQPNIYFRLLPNNAAIGAWTSALPLNNIAMPTNTYVQYTAQTFSLAGAGIIQGGLYQCELTRSTSVTGGTQLPSNWYLIEVTIEFT